MPHGGSTTARIQPTYEELKRLQSNPTPLPTLCIQPTYEELKLVFNARVRTWDP